MNEHTAVKKQCPGCGAVSGEIHKSGCPEQIALERPPMSAPGYESLSAVLGDASNQAAYGKGHERHAISLPFHKQPMQQIAALYGQGFVLGQAAKKMQESQRMTYGAARHELLGAINYIAGAIIALDMANMRSGGE